MILSIFFPEKGINISPNLTLRFPGINNIDSVRTAEYPDFYSIITPEDPPVIWKSQVDNKIEKNDGDDKIVLETNEKADEKIKLNNKSVIRNVIDFSSLDKKLFPIEYGTLGNTALNSFFESIRKSGEGNQPIRIIHYGDSQIEEDRISLTLRNKFQERFGGKGSGFFSLGNLNNSSFSVINSFSKNWQNFSLFNKDHAWLRKSGIGILTEFSRYEPVNFKSAGKTVRGAWIKITRQGNIPVSRGFDKIQILLSNVKSPIIIELFINDNFTGVKSITSGNSLQTVIWDFDMSPDKVQINFRGNTSPDIYGIALDGSSGISLDNVALRGRSGLGFSEMNKTLISNIHNSQNVKLLIFQFGINLVRGLLSDYLEYEEELYKQLMILREISPDVSILVVGLSDMSRKTNGRYESYPNIKLIRNAQKNAAKRSGCAFWDLYEAMGGENSMIQWVNANPPLARKDFAHFNLEGDKLVANLIFNAIMREFESYNHNKKGKY